MRTYCICLQRRRGCHCGSIYVRRIGIELDEAGDARDFFHEALHVYTVAAAEYMRTINQAAKDATGLQGD